MTIEIEMTPNTSNPFRVLFTGQELLGSSPQKRKVPGPEPTNPSPNSFLRPAKRIWPALVSTNLELNAVPISEDVVARCSSFGLERVCDSESQKSQHALIKLQFGFQVAKPVLERKWLKFWSDLNLQLWADSCLREK